MSCGYFPRETRWASQGRGPAFTLPAITVPHLARSGAISKVICARSTPRSLPAFGEQPSDESRKSSDLAAENAEKHFRLALVGAVVNEDAGRPLAFPAQRSPSHLSYPDEAQTVEIDFAVVAMFDVPEQHRLAEAVVRGLGEGAGARHSAAAIVEPVSGDVPAGNLGHEDLRSPMNDNKALTGVIPPAVTVSMWGQDESDFRTGLKPEVSRLAQHVRSTLNSTNVSAGMSASSAYPVQGAEFVTVEITQIGYIEFTCRDFAYTRRVFARDSTISDASGVPRIGLLSGATSETDSAAIRWSRWLAVNRL